MLVKMDLRVIDVKEKGWFVLFIVSRRDLRFMAPSLMPVSCFSTFSRFLRSRACSQLSVGLYTSVSLYAASAGRNAARPVMLAVLRCAGATSIGATHRKGGRGAKSASKLGGSLSVMTGSWSSSRWRKSPDSMCFGGRLTTSPRRGFVIGATGRVVRRD